MLDVYYQQNYTLHFKKQFWKNVYTQDCPEPNTLQHRSGYMNVFMKNELPSFKKIHLKETKHYFRGGGCYKFWSPKSLAFPNQSSRGK